MSNSQSITTERAGDIPLLLAQLIRMNVPSLLDQHFQQHGKWQGLSNGSVTTIWLAHLLSEADHRLSHVQPQAAQRFVTLDIWPPIAPLDQYGLLYVGDCRMTSLATRAGVVFHRDYYLCPLSAIQAPAEEIAGYVAGVARGDSVLRLVERLGADGTMEREPLVNTVRFLCIALPLRSCWHALYCQHRISRPTRLPPHSRAVSMCRASPIVLPTRT